MNFLTVSEADFYSLVDLTLSTLLLHTHYTHIHTHTYIYNIVYIYICVCVCAVVSIVLVCVVGIHREWVLFSSVEVILGWFQIYIGYVALIIVELLRIVFIIVELLRIVFIIVELFPQCILD